MTLYSIQCDLYILFKVVNEVRLFHGIHAIVCLSPDTQLQCFVLTSELMLFHFAVQPKVSGTCGDHSSPSPAPEHPRGRQRLSLSPGPGFALRMRLPSGPARLLHKLACAVPAQVALERGVLYASRASLAPAEDSPAVCSELAAAVELAGVLPSLRTAH